MIKVKTHVINEQVGVSHPGPPCLQVEWEHWGLNPETFGWDSNIILDYPPLNALSTPANLL